MRPLKPTYLPETWPVIRLLDKPKPLGWMEDIFHEREEDWTKHLETFKSDWVFDEDKFNMLVGHLAYTTSIDDVAVFRLDLTFTKDYRLDDYGVFMGLVKRLNDVIHAKEEFSNGLCFIARTVEYATETGLHLHLFLVYRWRTTGNLHAKADRLAEEWERICQDLNVEEEEGKVTRHWRSPLKRNWKQFFYRIPRSLVLGQYWSDPIWQSAMRVLAYFCKPDDWMTEHYGSARRLQTYLGDHYRVKHGTHSDDLLRARRRMKRNRMLNQALETDLLYAFKRKLEDHRLTFWVTLESRPIHYHYFDRDVHLPYHDANFYAAFKLRSRIHRDGYSILKLYHHHVHGSWPLQSEQDWLNFLDVWVAHYTYYGYVEEYHWNAGVMDTLCPQGWSHG